MEFVDNSHLPRSLLVSGSYFPPQVGGISQMMREVCSQLGARHVAVATAVPDPSPDATLGPVRVHRLPALDQPRSWPAALRLFAALGLVIARERPSVLQYATLEDAFAADWTHRRLGLRHILYAHGNEILQVRESRWHRSRTALLGASCVVANSRYTAQLLEDAGVPRERIQVVLPGCDLELLRRVPVDADVRARLTRGRPRARIVLTVGNLVVRKGHDTVIRALAAMPAAFDDVVYLIAGHGPERAALERLAAEAGVAERVIFLGHVATAELPTLYSAADVFVMASRERRERCDVEGFGIVFVEAAACGAPTIGGRGGGVGDALVDNETGLLVDPESTPAVSAALVTLLGDPALARRFGEAGRQRAARDFGWARFGRSVATILERVAAE